MNARFERIIDGIWRLKVPFYTVYTAVFLIYTAEGYVLVDCATTDGDVDEYIIPALEEQDVSLLDVKKIVITHDHSDHAGGLPRIIELMPHIEVVKEVTRLAGGVCTYPLPGHTKDFIGVLDERSCTLISGDGLQGAGVDKYRTSVPFKEEYLKTLERIKNDGRIENLLFSHAYEPWFKDKMVGREAVLHCLDECGKYV